MIYFIYACSPEIFTKQANFIGTDSEIINFQLDNNNVLTLLNEINSIDLFVSKKTFVITGANFFQIKSHKFKKKELELLITALNNTNENVVINLTKELNYKNPYVNLLEKREYLDLSDEKKVNNHFLNYFINQHKIQVDIDALESIKYNLNNDLLSIENELMKLASYTNFQTITINTVEENGIKAAEANSFALLDLLLKNDITKAHELYQQIINSDTNPVSLLGLISTQIRFCYQVKLLAQNNSFQDIARILKANPYRVKMTLRQIQGLSIHKLNSFYLNVANIDYRIKSGNLNQELIFDYLMYT